MGKVSIRGAKASASAIEYLKLIFPPPQLLVTVKPAFEQVGQLTHEIIASLFIALVILLGPLKGWLPFNISPGMMVKWAFSTLPPPKVGAEAIESPKLAVTSIGSIPGPVGGVCI